MLFDDRAEPLEVNITDMDSHKKILTIKKLDYMTEEYEAFIFRGLDQVEIGSRLLRANNVKLKKGTREDDAVGIIICDLMKNEDLVKYMVAQLDRDFCHMKRVNEISPDATPEHNALVDAIEAMILPELKVITGSAEDIIEDISPEDFKDIDDFDDLFDFEDDFELDDFPREGGYGLVSGLAHGDDLQDNLDEHAPAYLRNFAICPNIALDALSSMYIDCYKEFLSNIMMKKVFGKNGGPGLTNMQAHLQRMMFTISKELQDIMKYERDCSSCPYKDSCK